MHTKLGFCVGAGHANLGPRVFPASTLAPEPSPIAPIVCVSEFVVII